jgi:hypothetical protein
MSMRSFSVGPDSFIHFGDHAASAASSRASRSGSTTLRLRFTSADTIRKSMSPAANTAATRGRRSRRSIANCRRPAARPRLMFSRGRDLGDHVGVPVDRPVRSFGVVLGRPAGVELADSEHLPAARRALLARRRGDGIDHRAVVERFEHAFDATRGV